MSIFLKYTKARQCKVRTSLCIFTPLKAGNSALFPAFKGKNMLKYDPQTITE